MSPHPPDRLPLQARRTHWLESDAYDRAAFERLKRDTPSLQALETSGSKLLPHFDGFLLDLFALLFKLNTVVYPPEQVLPSAGFYRVILDHMLDTAGVDRLRQHTVLDELRAGLAALLLGERLLDVLKSERVLTRGEMLDFWNLQQQEDEIAADQAQAETADSLRAQARPVAQRQLDELAQRLRRGADQAERRLQHQATQIAAALRDGAERPRGPIVTEAERAWRGFDIATQDAESWSTQLGGGGAGGSPGAQIELGKQLATNPKIKKLAALVGRMRQHAQALRHTVFERVNAELYAVGRGDELSRLLPAELVALRHPVLRRDFTRRLLEAHLLQYSLRAPEHAGRGPMVVCIDGSSSMAGDKEIWAKAVSITLLDIAQRQRRPFRSICFAGPDTPLHVLDWSGRARAAPDTRQLLALAEHFPGGGTDFQKPLSAAVACLRQSRYRRGDIVFITDGECRVDDQWLGAFRDAKAALDFSLYSVLIDVGSSSLHALKDFSDKITAISQLTSEAGGPIFLTV